MQKRRQTRDTNCRSRAECNQRFRNRRTNATTPAKQATVAEKLLKVPADVSQSAKRSTLHGTHVIAEPEGQTCAHRMKLSFATERKLCDSGQDT